MSEINNAIARYEEANRAVAEALARLVETFDRLADIEREEQAVLNRLSSQIGMVAKRLERITSNSYTPPPPVGSLEEELAFEHKQELAEADTHPTADELYSEEQERKFSQERYDDEARAQERGGDHA